MKIEIDLDERTVKKIRALNMLQGRPHDLPSYLAEQITLVVSNALITEARDGEPAALPVSYQGHMRAYNDSAAPIPPGAITMTSTRPQAPANPEAFEDASGISEGLGDDDPDVDGERDPQGQVPDQGGLSEAELDRELNLGTSAPPAKAAPRRAIQGGEETTRPELAFADFAGLPAPRLPDPPPSAGRRKRAMKIAGRVSPAIGEQNSF